MQKTLKTLIVISLLFSGAAKAAEEDTLRLLFSQVPAQYVQSMTTAQFATIFLKSARSIDANLQVADDNDKISVYYRGRLVKSLYKPQNDDDADGWSELGGKILDLFLHNSAVAAKHDFELIDLMMANTVKSLDKDSKYYSGMENAEKRLPHRRNFSARMDGDNLYLKIGAFNNFSVADIRGALAEYPQHQGIIMDLRASPGGQLGTAVEVADLFLDEGIIASVRGRNPNEVTYYSAKDGDVASNKPLVVLVDGQTSSAAEVLTAALQEQSRAKVVGTRSYGKGTIQNLLKLPNGGTLSLSGEYLYTPSGAKLAETGVVPDICTYEMPENKDVSKLISAGKDENCGRESRSDSALEPEIAAILLKM